MDQCIDANSKKKDNPKDEKKKKGRGGGNKPTGIFYDYPNYCTDFHFTCNNNMEASDLTFQGNASCIINKMSKTK